MVAFARAFAWLTLLLGIVLLPLRAVAATPPMFIAYDAPVAPTATMRVEAGSSPRRQHGGLPEFVNDETRYGYDDGLNPLVVGGEGADHAHDSAVELLERRELVKGAIYDDLAQTVAAEATSTLPLRMARVIPAEFAGGASLGAPGAAEAWVTAADDLAGISTSEGLASRLTLVDSSGNLIPGARAVIELDTVTEGLASPVLRDAPGFVGGGFTAGGASEFVMPNLPLSQLSNVTVRIVP